MMLARDRIYLVMLIHEGGEGIGYHGKRLANYLRKVELIK
jgi:hypothetical protein